MLVGDADPVTPPHWAEMAMKRMSRVRTVVVPHGGHGFSGLLGAECLDRLQAEFLLSAAPAALDVSCARQVRRPPFAVPAQ
jgi:pimeloyl-ACP methyl ester carboxylesterase